jgi:5-methylcytosine-specific restriction endonuclease McrA
MSAVKRLFRFDYTAAAGHMKTPSAYLPAELRRKIRDHFANCCADCRTAEDLTVAIYECEHIVPRARGGESVFTNVCLACPTCDRYKADRTTATDPETQQAVDLFHPHRDVWSDHVSWNDDATEIVARTPAGRATIAALRMNRPQLTRVRRIWVAMSEHPPDFD